MKTEANGRMIAKTERSNAQDKLAPVDILANKIGQLRGMFEQVLPKHLTAERMTRIILMAVRTTPHLAECTYSSVVASLMACSMLGLEPNSPLKQAYLVPFRDNKKNCYECQVIIDYRGKIDLARRSGEVAYIKPEAVFEGDEFDYGLGLEPFLTHKPSISPDRENPTKLQFVYCVVRLKEKDTMPIFAVLSRGQIEQTKRRAKSDKFWTPYYIEMALKTAVHACMKWAPRSAELALSDDIEDRFERGASIIPTLPDEVSRSLLASGAASESDMSDAIDIDPETDQENAHTEQEPSEPQRSATAKREPAPAAKSEPSSAKTNGDLPHIFPSEIKDVKRWAQENGDEELAELCGAALTGDATAKAKVIAARDAMPQREIE